MMRLNFRLVLGSALLISGALAVDQECVNGTVVWQSEEHMFYLSTENTERYIGNFITQSQVDGLSPMHYQFGRMHEEYPCRASKSNGGINPCPNETQCVSFQSIHNHPNWYLAGPHGFSYSPEFEDVESDSILFEKPSDEQISWCLVPSLSGNPDTWSIQNVESGHYFSFTRYKAVMSVNPVRTKEASWYRHDNVCCEGGSFLCGDQLGSGVGGGNGDPHFRTWSGGRFDFHGQCDLVLVKAPNFGHGIGMDVHIRTKLQTWWSYIEAAVVKIGENTLEVMGGANSFAFWVNGKPVDIEELQETTLGDYPVKFEKKKANLGKAKIDLGNGDELELGTYKQFVKVTLKAKHEENFKNTAGLMGTYPDGRWAARNMTGTFRDKNLFGQEWQVNASEPMLFHSPPFGTPEQPESSNGLLDTVLSWGKEKPAPMKCVMPDHEKALKEHRRRLGEAAITEDAAAEACAGVEPFEMKNCIADVLATNDKDMAASYF